MPAPRASGRIAERTGAARRRSRQSPHHCSLLARHRGLRRSGCRGRRRVQHRPRSRRIPASTPTRSTACCACSRRTASSIRTADGRYEHSAASRLLRSDDPRSLRSYVRMNGLRAMWDRYAELGETARTGRPKHDWASLVELFRRASRGVGDLQRRDGQQVAYRAAGRRGRLRFQRLRHDRRHRRRARPFAEADPRAARREAQGILFELAHVIADATPAPRLALAAGDFFTDPLARGGRLSVDGCAARLGRHGRRAHPRRRAPRGARDNRGC